MEPEERGYILGSEKARLWVAASILSGVTIENVIDAAALEGAAADRVREKYYLARRTLAEVSILLER